jgi:hypothetical protein
MITSPNKAKEPKYNQSAKQAGPHFLLAFIYGPNWVPCNKEAQVMHQTLEKQRNDAYAPNIWKIEKPAHKQTLTVWVKASLASYFKKLRKGNSWTSLIMTIIQYKVPNHGIQI